MTLATAVHPTAVRHDGHFIIATFDGKKAALASSLLFAKEHGTVLHHCVYPRNKTDQKGFQKVEMYPQGYEIETDGILVTKGHSAGMFSRDCAITAIMDNRRDEGVLLHCSRLALTPTQHLMDRNYTIITAGLAALTDRGSKLADLSVWITASICKKCFTHDLARDKALLAPFDEHHRLEINEKTVGLDLVGIIRTQLHNAGVTGEMAWDGLCTNSDPGLASKRGHSPENASNLAFMFVQ